MLTGGRERFKKVSILVNDKGHYELHFMFPDDQYSHFKDGEFWLSSDSATEPFVVNLKFS